MILIFFFTKFNLMVIYKCLVIMWNVNRLILSEDQLKKEDKYSFDIILLLQTQE